MIPFLRWFARKFWLLSVTLVIALALLVQAGRLLSPQVEQYRPQISAWLSDSLGVPVRMERLSLRWQALEVALQLDGLQLGENSEMRMGYGLFQLDLLASLWNRELVWKNLEVHDFSTGITRGDDGHWYLDGFPVAAEADEHSGDGGTRLADPARLFQLSPKVQVRNARITVRLADGQLAQLDLPQIQLENGGGFHRLIARAQVSRDGAADVSDGIAQVRPVPAADTETLRLVLEGRGNPRDEANFSLNGYLQLNDLVLDDDIVTLLHQLTPLPEAYHWHGRKLARGKLWLARDTEQGYRLLGQLSLEQMAPLEASDDAGEQQGETAAALAPLGAVAGNLSGRWQPGAQWQLALQDIQLDWRGLQMPPLNLQASSGADAGLQLAADVIDLGGWSRILKRLQVLKGPADEWLRALEPSGQLRNIQLSRGSDGRVKLGANLIDFSASAHRGAPAVKGLNGYLYLEGADGHVELGGGPLSMHFPQLYREAFHFERASGTVAWRVDRDGNSVQVFSGPLQLDGQLGEVDGQFLLQLPYFARTRASDFTLALGLRDAPVSAQRLLVPLSVGDDLRQWLDKGLGKDNPGRVASAAFVYRGTSYRDGEDGELLALGRHPERQTVQLAVDVTAADLDYAPGWPAARDVDARLLLSDRNVQVNARAAKLWNIDARDIEVGVTPNPSGKGSLLGVHAKLSGPAADGLRLLRQSPLRKQLGSAFDDWRLEGRIDGSLTLSQPLGGAGLPARQTVTLSLDGGELELRDLRLQIDGLHGRVDYDSERGLAGTSLEGKLWGRPLRARIHHPQEGDTRDTQVVLEGSAAIESVHAWSQRPELQWLEGAFDYRALLTIPAKSRQMPYSAVFELNSDLAGVAVQLPAPLGKLAEDKTDYVLRVPIGEQGSLFHMKYGEHLQGLFWQVKGELERAAIALNAEAKLPEAPGLSIGGHLSQVDLPRLHQLLQVYDVDKSGEGGTAGDPLPISLDLSTDRLILGTVEVPDIHVRGSGQGARWQLTFDSEMAAGDLNGPLDGSAPLRLALSHLRLPGQESTAEAVQPADPWAGFDFTSLPQMDFSTENLAIGDEVLGRWSFRVRPSSERLVLSDIRGAMRGVRVEGNGEDEQGAQLTWLRDGEGRESSRFTGRLVADNLADVQRAWGQDPLIESKSASFDTSLRWDGSPLRAAGNLLSGELKIDIRKGRFLRATDSAGPALLRLLSLFNFDTWARRLRLDFSDLYQSGLAFDSVRGEVVFEGDGQLLIAVPIQVEGPTSELQMAGRVNLEREDLNLTLVATLPVGNNLALVAALAGGLPAAAGVYLISKAFKKQVDKVASVSYRISGAWDEPEVRFDKLFDGDGAQREGAAAERQREPVEVESMHSSFAPSI
ncbi:YhdP family protein [Microbulbifer thermotolerans]|uniref:Exonuclease VII small subunit n=1 Tax=Microbulbifer thermotolerans TaxID=252514 RepID=A0A143HKI5_MICTH|nr:YhdP family protein [Microbulbifer thermotolerans]AMX02021.1 exonuclease VII small subunit [Microbulbifer thermotolerans]MCX2780589.1 YhdP family protein [Microbulbifer thermotolerans]MCX2794284.1 YhdP family protein [Microbulbifer thermotolerans]MCX2803481.1 YhdP family protein [Microbulbifer thermotolerans]MCX2834243.1 YhdP family protein [Microbulbifer thermotolerans]